MRLTLLLIIFVIVVIVPVIVVIVPVIVVIIPVIVIVVFAFSLVLILSFVFLRFQTFCGNVDSPVLSQGDPARVFYPLGQNRQALIGLQPRLGIMIEKTDNGVRIIRVVKGSVAEASDLAASDIVVSAAGQPIEKVSQLIAIIARQATGTWLPLMIRRNGKVFEVVAKFPPKTAKVLEKSK